MNHEYTRALFIAVKLKNTQGEITCHIISFLHPPKSTGDAVDLIDRLNDLIQFIADLSVMPTTPDNEFSFSSNGYSGLYYFLIFLQETLENCNAVISETHTGKEIV